MDAGGEWQQGFTNVSIHRNRNGNADTLRSTDEINNRQSFAFTQANIDTKGWSITVGASINFLKVKFERFMPATLGVQRRRFNNEIAPRIAILKKLNKVNFYTGLSKGFSPPTTAELLPI